MTFVPLNRTFGRPDKNEDDYSYLLYSKKNSGEHSWDDLLSHQKVVVLASAGSGKTVEFQEQAKLLRSNGTVSVFIPIEELASQTVEDCLSAEDEKAIAEWRATGEAGYFFLDSVDEAKLKDAASFRRSLRKLVKFLGDSVTRAHLIVSCRPSDWNHETDLKLVSDILLHPPELEPHDEQAETATSRDDYLFEPIFNADEYTGTGDLDKNPESSEPSKNNNDVLVVALQPLSADQQRRLIESEISGDVTPFLDEVSKNGLKAYTKRPSDLLELCRYWQQHKKFSSLSEMTAHNIGELLKDNPNRPDGKTLSDDAALAGAQILALGLVLSKKLTLLAPGHSKGEDHHEVVDPAVLLSDWTPAAREALLRRALFAPASFGRVRFQHRSTFEYLAAKQLLNLIKDEQGREQVESILFQETFGILTIPPALRPIAAWLSAWDEKIRETVLVQEPMELVRFGDAKSLPLSCRKRLLKTLTEKHRSGEVSRTEVDDRAVWAFSTPDIAEEIKDAWSLTNAWDLNVLLLEMIEQAKIHACADLAEEAARSPKDSRSLIHSGVSALIALDEQARLKKFSADVVSKKLKLSDETVASLCLQLYPDYLSTADLLVLIERAKRPKEFSTEGFTWRLSRLFEQCSAADIETFLCGISELALRTPLQENWRRVSIRYGYLAKYFTDIAQTALDRLQKPEASEGFIQLLLAAERRDQRDSYKEYPRSLDDRISENSALKQALFWADIKEIQQNEKKRDLDERPWNRTSIGFSGGFWRVGPDDRVWLGEALHDDLRTDYERDTAYYLLVDLLRAADELHAQKAEMKKLADGSQLRKDWLQRAFNSPKTPKYEKKRKKREERQHRKKRRRRAINAASWKAFSKRIESELPVADYSTGWTDANWHFVSNLTRWLRWKSNLRLCQAPRSWHDLRPAFGDEVSELYFNHMSAIWRAFPPKRPRWKGNTCTSYKITSYAFGGIGMEADSDPEWAKKLNPTEAKRAAQHMARAEEGAPDWFFDLLEAHPEIVLREIRSELKREWKSANEWPRSWLNYFADEEESLDLRLAALAVSVILNNDPVNAERLSLGLRILKRVDLTDAQWQKLEKKARRLASAKSAELNERARYLAVLCSHSIDRALPVIEKALASVSKEKAQAILGQLFDGRHSHGLAPEYLQNASTTNIEKLVLLAYQYVSPRNDVRHEGAYSPGARDHAEAARSTIFDALYNKGSQSAYEAMRRLATNKDVASNSHWLLVVSKRMIEAVSSLVSWSEAEVRDFAAGGAAPVKTPRQFFELCRSIVRSIASDLHTADASSKPLLRKAEYEAEVRDWLAERIQDRANGRLARFREVQVKDEKRPDLIFSSNSNNSQIAIELKHGNKKTWTVRTLRKTIEDQLVKKYLLPEERRCGLLVISLHTDRIWIHPETRKRLDFEGLISELRKHAAKVQKEHSVTIHIDVIGIDSR